MIKNKYINKHPSILKKVGPPSGKPTLKTYLPDINTRNHRIRKSHNSYMCCIRIRSYRSIRCYRTNPNQMLLKLRIVRVEPMLFLHFFSWYFPYFYCFTFTYLMITPSLALPIKKQKWFTSTRITRITTTRITPPPTTTGIWPADISIISKSDRCCR